MPTEYKTLTFPNTPGGQKQKIKALQREAQERWIIVSETITQGKFHGKTACCLASACLPCGFCAGSSDGEINVTLQRDDDDYEDVQEYRRPNRQEPARVESDTPVRRHSEQADSPSSTKQRTPPRRRRRRAREESKGNSVLGCAVLCIIALAVVWFFWPSSKSASTSKPPTTPPAKTAPAKAEMATKQQPKEPEKIEILKPYRESQEFEKALALYLSKNKKEQAEGFQMFKTGMNNGDPDCMAGVGAANIDGFVVKKDLQHGLNLIRDAADKGSGFAQAYIGYIYLFGEFGVPKDRNRGEEYINKAISQRVYLGYARLAEAYAMGASVPQDIDRAVKLYEEGAKIDPDYAEVSAKAIKKLKEQPDFTLTADQLVKAYVQNEVAADQKYKGAKIRVTGRVEAVGKGLLNDMYVALKTQDQWEFRGVQCFFDKKDTEQLAKIRKGDRITIQGRGGGLMANVLLRDCWIVNE